MKPWVIMRSRNDMPVIGETLEALRGQDHPFDLIAFDNGSTDGTLDKVKGLATRMHHIPAGTYVPGQVLNQAMKATEGEIVVFLNSDCTPRDEKWLSRLIAGFSDDRVAAVFGRQVARPDCHPLHNKDTEDTYGNGSPQDRWKHCFSMASSAIRRSVWSDLPFTETLQYSEDIDWSWRAHRKGFQIRYAPFLRVTGMLGRRAGLREGRGGS